MPHACPRWHESRIAGRAVTHDVIILGAGPAGGAAALAAAESGLSVVVFDEQSAAGGQIWRAPVADLVLPFETIEKRDGDALRAALAQSPIDLRLGRRVWSVGGSFRVDALGPDGNEYAEAPALIAATGAHERVVPFSGWTLPGVIGLAAATVLIKSHGAIPGSPVLVAGCGPLLAAVAASIIKAGGDVAAIVDLASRTDWLKAAPHLATRPSLLTQGLGWVLKIAGRGVPVYFNHAVRHAGGNRRVEQVVIGPVDRDGRPLPGGDQAFAVNSLVVGHGLTPGAEIPKLFRADMVFDRLRGGYVPELDADGRTSVKGLYAIGDGAGIRGAAAAVETGTLAGLAVARDLGRLSSNDWQMRSRAPRVATEKLSAFSDAIAGLMALRPKQVKAIADDVVVCRCEDVTRRDIKQAARDGAQDINQLKHFTRCGMGPCQGRMCGEVAAELLADAMGVTRDQLGYWTGRPPLRPVSLSELLGQFDYSDIPIPKPAPL
jgi:thioredoxin reductase/bacterioferritin-associated ferredoxin